MGVETWVLFGLLVMATCSLAFEGRSFFRDEVAALMADKERLKRPTDLPFSPFEFFSSGTKTLLFSLSLEVVFRLLLGWRRGLRSSGYTDKNEPESLKWLVCPLGH